MCVQSSINVINIRVEEFNFPRRTSGPRRASMAPLVINSAIWSLVLRPPNSGYLWCTRHRLITFRSTRLLLVVSCLSLFWLSITRYSRVSKVTNKWTITNVSRAGRALIDLWIWYHTLHAIISPSILNFFAPLLLETTAPEKRQRVPSAYNRFIKWVSSFLHHQSCMLS
jgi:hypothetical protein